MRTFVAVTAFAVILPSVAYAAACLPPGYGKPQTSGYVRTIDEQAQRSASVDAPTDPSLARVSMSFDQGDYVLIARSGEYEVGDVVLFDPKGCGEPLVVFRFAPHGR